MCSAIESLKTICFKVHKAIDSTRPSSLQNPNLAKTNTNPSITLSIYEERKKEEKAEKEKKKAAKKREKRLKEINKAIHMRPWEELWKGVMSWKEYKAMDTPARAALREVRAEIQLQKEEESKARKTAEKAAKKEEKRREIERSI